MEKEYKIFELGEAILDKNCYKYEIPGLDGIYSNEDNELKRFGSGIVGLLRAPDRYKGYCQLYFANRSQKEDENIIIEFYPAYTKDGEPILIKTPIESPFVVFCTEAKLIECQVTLAGYLIYSIGGW